MNTFLAVLIHHTYGVFRTNIYIITSRVLYNDLPANTIQTLEFTTASDKVITRLSAFLICQSTIPKAFGFSRTLAIIQTLFTDLKQISTLI